MGHSTWSSARLDHADLCVLSAARRTARARLPNIRCWPGSHPSWSRRQARHHDERAARPTGVPPSRFGWLPRLRPCVLAPSPFTTAPTACSGPTTARRTPPRRGPGYWPRSPTPSAAVVVGIGITSPTPPRPPLPRPSGGGHRRRRVTVLSHATPLAARESVWREGSGSERPRLRADTVRGRLGFLGPRGAALGPAHGHPRRRHRRRCHLDPSGIVVPVQRAMSCLGTPTYHTVGRGYPDYCSSRSSRWYGTAPALKKSCPVLVVCSVVGLGAISRRPPCGVAPTAWIVIAIAADPRRWLTVCP